MITYKSGCLIQAKKDGEIDYLIHCCNAQGVMGSGIAKQIKKEFPLAYKEYRNVCDRRGNKHNLGSLSGVGGVINLIGQEYYGRDGSRYGNYGAISTGLCGIGLYIQYLDETTLPQPLSRKLRIGFPYKFASDRAGCDWGIIHEMIEFILSGSYDVYFYKLEN